MADKKEINVQRFLKRVKENVTSSLFDWELESEEGLLLSEVIVPFGEPIEIGEQELEALIEEILLQVELALNKPKRKKRKKLR